MVDTDLPLTPVSDTLILMIDMVMSQYREGAITNAEALIKIGHDILRVADLVAAEDIAIRAYWDRMYQNRVW